MKLSPDTHSAAQVVELLNLAPLPHEGGWFRRTHEANPTDVAGRRAWSMIHVLFTPDQFSALHRVAADELWIFQAGDPLDLFQLNEAGEDTNSILGLDQATGECSQVPVSAHVWQGARLREGGRWALVTCVVVPEFRWNDFQLGKCADLLPRFPDHADSIRRLTRG